MASIDATIPHFSISAFLLLQVTLGPGIDSINYDAFLKWIITVASRPVYKNVAASTLEVSLHPG